MLADFSGEYDMVLINSVTRHHKQKSLFCGFPNYRKHVDLEKQLYIVHVIKKKYIYK